MDFLNLKSMLPTEKDTILYNIGKSSSQVDYNKTSLWVGEKLNTS